MLSKPDAIIFDWDDTLVSSWQVVKAAVNKTLLAFGREAWSEEEARNRIGPPAKVLFTELFGADNWQQADEIYLKAYQDSIGDNIKLYDVAIDIFEWANQHQVKLFIVSAKRGSLLRKEAETLGISGYFEKIVGTGDAVEDKPSNASVCFALENSKIDVNKNEIWFVGDGISDLKCAYNSDTKPILIESKLASEDKIAEFPPVKRFKNLIEFKEYLFSFL